MTPFRENLRGILAITTANLLFLVNDTLIKLANATLPLGQILFIRGICATALLIPVVIVTGSHRNLAALRNPSLIFRTIAEVCAAILFILALFHLPIANLNAILQVVPLAVTGVAAILLAEPVGWRRWGAIAVGFVGVLVIIRPGFAGFDGYSLVALASMAFIVVRDLTTRTMPRAIPALFVALVTAVAVCLSGPVVGIAAGETWPIPDARSLALAGGAAAFLIFAYLFAVDFMRHGDIAVIAPFRYIVVLWAIVVGYLVWRETPDLPMLAGTALVVGSGVYTIHRERGLARIVAESDIDR